MMSKKQWSAMLCLHISYLFVGASIFYHIENPLELAERAQERIDRFEIIRLIRQNYAPTNPDAQADLMDKLSNYCQRTVANTSDSEEPAPVWDFYHSFFFSYTVVSTIGYGNLAPSTSFGRILMIFYGLVGIPINGILFANLGAYFGTTFKNLYQRYKVKNPTSGSNIDYQVNRFGLFGQIALYLLPGFLFFIFMPACLFVLFEGWDYALAVYYAFVTLTTIGFGDYVAGITDKGYGVYFIIYKIFLIFWITFGLGYLVMVVGFLTQGLKSKRMLKLERMVAQNIKQTQSKIWNNVTKDVSYLRRLLNEVYMMRFKPVYHDEIPPPKIHRSSSCPSLSFMKDEQPKIDRRRANSEAIPPPQTELLRVRSESDLGSINREKTFDISAIMQPVELLAQVVNALGNLQEENTILEEEEGIHGFSDEEILASENAGSTWSIGGDKAFAVPPKVPRGRAASEIRMPAKLPDRFYNNELTWGSSGSTGKMRDILMARRAGKLSVPNSSNSKVSAIGSVESIPEKSFLSKFNPFKKSQKTEESSDTNISFNDNMTPAEYLRRTARGRISLAPFGEQRYPQKPKQRRQSNVSLQQNNEVLEQTTIADLIRALTVLHTSSETDNPRRKMGTASFTPPNMSSTFNVNGPPPGPRRFSVHPAFQTSERRGSINTASALPPSAARRRFSLHPASSNSLPFNPSISPLALRSSNQPRRGSLLLPPPYTPYSGSESPTSGLLGRRRLNSTGARRSSLWANGGTPNLRTRRPLFPPSIIEGQTSGSRTRHESLTDIRIDELFPKES